MAVRVRLSVAHPNRIADNSGMPDRYCRNFQGPAAAIENTWGHIAVASHKWRKGARTWGTNSKPFEVVNEAGLVGVAKPGAGVGDPQLRRAAHEKLASDLAFLLGLPIPPVILCDKGSDFPERHVAVSAWAFAKAEEWQKVAGQLGPARRDLATAVSSAMAIFDTWIGASDRKEAHVLVNDDGDVGKLDLAYIDYAFAFSKDWKTDNEKVTALCQPLPIQPLNAIEAMEIAARIEALEEEPIRKIVNRIPIAYLSDAEKGVIINNLLTRRSAIRKLVPLTT